MCYHWVASAAFVEPRGVMGNKILCISMIRDTVQYLEVDRQRGGFFPKSVNTAASSEELMTACNRADEILVNSSFSSAVYDFGAFPKLKRRYLQNLVNRSAQEKHGMASGIEVRFKVGADVLVQELVKSQVASVAVEKEEISSIHNKFKQHFKKIKIIAPLPLALAAAVSRSEKPADHYALIWFGENSTIISINTADGQVKLARSVPLRLPAEELPSGQEAPAAAADQESLDLALDQGPLGIAAAGDSPFERFSRELDRELAMTYTFFKQSFRMKSPEELYVLGSSKLEKVLRRYPLSEEISINFGFSKPPVQGMGAEQINENIHLLGNLFLGDDINFVPREEYLGRQVDRGLRYAFAGVAALIVLAVVWGAQIQASKAAVREVYNSRLQERQELQQGIGNLQATIAKLSPIEARKNLYESLYIKQPRWAAVLNELAVNMPSGVVLQRFQVTPAGDDKWQGKLNGEIRAASWQEGLNVMREFHGKLHASSYFDVRKVDYSRGSMEELPRAAYTFQFDLDIFSGAE